jgi:hypothetical protein
MHDHSKNYYHSEKTGRIIAKDRCYIPEEPPCYGYEPTCWTRWPADCPKCGVDCQCGTDEIVVSEQVIATPGESIIVDEPQPAELDAASSEELEEAIIDEPFSELEPDVSELEPDYDDGAKLEMPAVDLTDILPRDFPAAVSLPVERTNLASNVDRLAERLMPEIDEQPVPVQKNHVQQQLAQPQSVLRPIEQLTPPVEKRALPVPVPDQDRRSSRRKRTNAVAVSLNKSTTVANEVAPPETMDAEIGEEFSGFDVLATSNWVAKVDHMSHRIPSFRIPVKTDPHVSVASETRNSPVERITTKRESNVSTVSFR